MSGDAELVRLAEAIVENCKTTDALDDQRDRSTIAHERVYLRALISQQVAKGWELRAALALLPATTMEGFRAKANIVRLFDYEGDGFAFPESGGAMAYSLANDLLGDTDCVAGEACLSLLF